MAVGVKMPRPQPFPSVCASAQRQGCAAPGCKKRSPPLTLLRGVLASRRRAGGSHERLIFQPQCRLWHDAWMPTSKKSKRLLDAYRFAGLRPLQQLVGVFGDAHARVVRLVRRSKKRPVAAVAGYTEDGTTALPGVPAICPAGPIASTSSSRCAGWPAETAGV